MKAMLEGYHVRVDVPIEERVRNIVEDYIKPIPFERWIKEARASLDAIKRKLGGERHALLADLLERQRNDSEFTKILLREYYDKMYVLSHAPADFYHAVIHDAGDWEKVEKVFTILR